MKISRSPQLVAALKALGAYTNMTGYRLDIIEKMICSAVRAALAVEDYDPDIKFGGGIAFCRHCGTPLGDADDWQTDSATQPEIKYVPVADIEKRHGGKG